MLQEKIDVSLESLENSLKQMKALVAWQDLRQAEARPNQPPAFQIYDPAETDLKNEFAFFVSTLAGTHTILNEHTAAISPQRHREVERRLLKLEQEAQSLDFHKRFSSF